MGISQKDCWPQLVRRLRLSLGVNQSTLAAMLQVDQASVSRWERGLQMPAFGMQLRLRDALYRQEPKFSLEQIEALPVIAAILDFDHIGLCIAASQRFAESYGCRPAELRCVDLKPKWTRSLLGLWDCLRDHHAVKSNSFAVCHATALRPDNAWVHETLTPIPGSYGVLLTAADIAPPGDIEYPKEFKLEVLSKDELTTRPAPAVSYTRKLVMG